jgi:hypothetical protein
LGAIVAVAGFAAGAAFLTGAFTAVLAAFFTAVAAALTLSFPALAEIEEVLSFISLADVPEVLDEGLAATGLAAAFAPLAGTTTFFF